jgi:hypothetical protein
MWTRLSRLCLFSILAIAVLTLELSPALADSVGLSGGGSISGSTIFANQGGGLILCTSGICAGPPWTITSTTGVSWSNTTPATFLSDSTQKNAYSGETYTLVDIATFVEDAAGNGYSHQLYLGVEGTFGSFEQSVLAIPFGQSIQIPLLTTLGSGACSNPSECSSELDEIFTGGVLTFSQYSIVGPAYITITNDPGLYEVTPTSVPLGSTVPEPATLVLLIPALLGLAVFRLKKATA